MSYLLFIYAKSVHYLERHRNSSHILLCTIYVQHNYDCNILRILGLLTFNFLLTLRMTGS